MIKIEINQQSDEAKALLRYLKTLSYVQFQESEELETIEWLVEDISDSEKQLLESRIYKLEKGESKFYSWEEVENDLDDLLNTDDE